MRDVSRRDFMRRTVRTVVATAAMPAVATAQAPNPFATSTRTLGRSGVQCTLLGMGTGVRAWNGSSELTRKGRDAYLALLEHAYHRSLRYFDLADMYGAHDYMRQMLNRVIPRDQVTILTKTVSREADLARADLERFRKELNTDYLDIVLLHCLTAPDWPETTKACMDMLEEAKAKGIIRAHGVSCHTLEALTRAAETDWVDVILARLNPFGAKMDAPVEAVLPVLQKAHAAGKGVIAMKVVGEGELSNKIAESFGYILRLDCVDAMAIGFLAPEEIDSAIALIEASRPA